MKSEKQIKEMLEQTYNYRLGLRLQRKSKKSCRNCKKGYQQQIDLGQFGIYSRYFCCEGKDSNKCEQFECKYTRQMIQRQMIQEIKDPSICGCKQPKIAALLWVLHQPNKTFFDRIKKIFKK